MPTYEFQCPNGHRHVHVMPFKSHRSVIECETCGLMSESVIFAPILVTAAQDVCYDSPIAGGAI